MNRSHPADRQAAGTESGRIEELQLVMDEFEQSLAHLGSLSGEHAGNAMLNLALGRLLEQHGRERTAALLARVVEELWSNTLPETPERALDVFRLDA